MLSPIERLPVEVFDMIAADVDLPAYQAIRLASRQLHSLSFATFVKRYFCELNTTLGSASLDCLLAVSNHSHLSSAVTVLDIRLLNHLDYKQLTKISRVGIFPPPKRFPKVPGVRPEDINEEATLYSDVSKDKCIKHIVKCLARALKRLLNLKTIRFRALRADPHEWRATGMPEGDEDFRATCFRAVVDAIIKSKIKLTDFSMARGRRTTTLSKCANLPYPTLQFSQKHLCALQSCFANLESLTLSVTTTFNGELRVPGWENGISNLIAAAPSIQNLALSLGRSNFFSEHGAAVIHALALSCRLPNLKSFCLVNCTLHEKDMVAFATAHSDSLQLLVFCDLHILTGAWSPLFDSLRDMKQLECLRMMSLSGQRDSLLFKRGGSDCFKWDVKKTGRSMPDMLDDVVVLCNRRSRLFGIGNEVD